MPDRLTSLEVFAKVAATGSFSAAGRALGMSQTMVTKHITSLEARLGVQLFHRTTRKLSMTVTGQSYLEACSRVLADLDAADRSVAADRFEPRGQLRIAAPMSFGSQQIAPRLPEFARLYPKIAVELGLNDRLVDLAAEGWDLAIRIGFLEDSSLVARRLAPCRTVVCASPAYLRAHGTPQKVAELSGHNCLGYTLSRLTGVERWAFGRKGDIEVPVSGNLRANNGDALRLAAVAGQGIIYQPVFLVAGDLRAGTLVRIALDHPPIELGAIYAVFLPSLHPAAKIRAFIDFLLAHVTGDPSWEGA